MVLTPAIAAALLRDIRILDGGMASELEYRGARIDGPLWSAHVLEDAPEKILEVHQAYIEAGAQCIETAGYQVSRMGYAEIGLPPAHADSALLRSVRLARQAAVAFPRRPSLIAASLGPYGAALHNGAEYHGNYDCTPSALADFHRQRIAVLASATGPDSPDVFAFETLPSLEEAQAIGNALADWPDAAAWFSFTCRDDMHVAHGESLTQCAQFVSQFPQTIAIGVNCTLPAYIPSLIRELRAASDKPAIVYPNSGEGWDPAHRHWTGASDPAAFSSLARDWFAVGAQIVGGCCRTRPEHIALIAQHSL